MKDEFAELVVLVLPFNATTGPRIVLDGINGVIEGYDAANNLYISISPNTGSLDNGVQVYDPPTGAKIALAAFGGAVLLMATGDVDENTAGTLATEIAGAGGTRNMLSRWSSGNFTGREDAGIKLHSESQDGTEEPLVLLVGDDVQLVPSTSGVPNPSASLPRGLIARQILTANSAVWTADTVTDHALNNVDVIAGRTYDAHLHAQYVQGTNDGRWNLDFRVDGVVVDRFAALVNDSNAIGTFVSHRATVDSTVEWTPSASGTVDLDVYADEIVDGSSLQLEGAATITRIFSLTDKGVL